MSEFSLDDALVEVQDAITKFETDGIPLEFSKLTDLIGNLSAHMGLAPDGSSRTGVLWSGEITGSPTGTVGSGSPDAPQFNSHDVARAIDQQGGGQNSVTVH